MSEPFDGLGLSLADVIDRLFQGQITKAEAATALAPILSATSDGDVGALVEEVIGVLGRVTGIIPVEVPDEQDRPSNLIGAPGSYAWERRRKIFWGPKDKVTGWPEGDVMTEGRSALQVLIVAGILPAGSTAEDFADWLADSQIAKVQPFAVAASASASAADGHAGDAAAAADLAIAARDLAVPAAQLASEKALATGLDAEQTAADRAAVADAMPAFAAAVAAAEQTGLDRAAATAAAEATAADRQAVAWAMPAFDAAVTAAQTAAEKADVASARADDAEAARVAAVAAQAAAEQAAAEAEAIAGGDFLSEVEANALYRKLADQLALTDVAGLVAALEGKATPADVNAAVQAIVGMAPAELDTLKEIADRLVGAEGDYAALVLVLAGKASINDLTALAARIAALEAVPALTFATVAEVRAGKAAGKIIDPKVMADALAPVVVTPASAATAVDFDLFLNAQIVLEGPTTIGTPANGYPGKSGLLTLNNNAAGNAAVAWHSSYRMPKGGITLEPGPAAVTRVPFQFGGAGVVNLFPASKWV